MANQAVGGLFATVTLDTSDAIRKLRLLDRQLKRVFATSATSNAGGGMDRLARSSRRASQEVNKAGQATKKTTGIFSRFGRQTRRTARDTEGLKKQLKGVSDTLSTTLASFGAARSGNYFYGLSSGLQAITRGFGAAGGAAGGLAISLGAIVASAAVLAGGLAGVALGLRKITRVSNESAANLERLTVSFEALLGSQSRAREELDFLIEAAEISPYFTEAIVSLDRFLLAQGLLNDELRRGITQRLIDFGSAAGLSGDQLQNLAYALGQVYNAGRLTGDEARQLRNNFLGVQNVLRTLPRYAEATGTELAKAMESGSITSQDFFEGFFAYTARFGDAAAAQQQTLIGLKDTFIDVFQLGLGAANLEVAEFNKILSPLENIKAVFRELLNLFKELDFKPLVASLGVLVNTFIGPFTRFLSNEGERFKNFFEEGLPRAIIGAANVFRFLAVSVEIIGRVISVVFRQISALFVGFTRIVTDGSAGGAEALKVLGRVGIVAVGVLILPFVKLAFVIGTVITLVRSLIVLLTEGFAPAADTFLKGILGTVQGIATIGGGLVDAWNALDNLQPIRFEDIFPEELTSGSSAPVGVGAEDLGFPEAGTSDGGAGKASATAKAMEKAMDLLFDLTRRWFNTRSELEKGFLGKDGFEATVDSIINTGKRLIGALRDIAGAEGVVDLVEQSTFKLIDLAKAREKAADALSAAEDKLAQAIKARDDFASKVRSQALAFANAFDAETETVKKFQLVSERGFFFETEEKKQKSFVDTLKERLDALRNFLADVKRLKALGLDEGLLEGIVAAGPEQAGQVAAALAAGGQAIVDEVNVLQTAVTQVSDELADFGANTFYDAGVTMAQAQVDGLTSELAGIETAAQDTVNIIYDAVEPLAAEMEDAGSAAGSGLTSGLESGSAALGDILAGINSQTSSSLDDIVSDFAAAPGGFAGGLLAGETKVTDAINSLFDEMDSVIDPWFEDSQIKWSDLFGNFLPTVFSNAAIQIGKIREGILKTMDSAIEGTVNGIAGFIETVVNFVLDALTNLVNSGINVLNRLIDGINKIPGLNISRIGQFGGFGTFDIPTYRSDIYEQSSGSGELFGPFLPDGPAVPNVQVFIGDEELTQIVDTRVTVNEDNTYRAVAGRRRY